MSDYKPTTEEVRADYIRDHTRNFDSYMVGRSLTSEQEFYGDEFDRWLDSVIAEKRAEWEAEQGEVEWEYGWAGNRRATVFYDSKEEAEEFIGAPKKFARRRAGEWQEV